MSDKVEYIGWRKVRGAPQGLAAGVKEQVYQRALQEQMSKGIPEKEAIAIAERKTAESIFGQSRSHFGWEAVESTRATTKADCYQKCMDEEKKSHEGEWEWSILPVGMRPEGQSSMDRYRTRRMLPRDLM